METKDINVKTESKELGAVLRDIGISLLQAEASSSRIRIIGTKDGGYLMANWGIYKAKENLTTISKDYGIEVIFFDGRGGPPARGGGKTHKFYASLGRNIANIEIQLTIQGQTVSSRFGTIDAAQFIWNN